mgnify:CR=1 FL=1
MSDSNVTISVKKSPFLIRLILSVVLAIMILIPLWASYLVLSTGDGLHIGLAFSFIFFWGLGFYMLKIILWNSVGREILILGNEKIEYIADYGLFKDGRKEIETNQLATEIIYEDDSNNTLGRLRLTSNNESIESVVKIRFAELKELQKEIIARYKN